MGRMIALYGLGFAVVWAVVLAACVGDRLRQRAAGSWDRAFVRELMGPRSTRDPGPEARAPETRAAPSREADPT